MTITPSISAYIASVADLPNMPWTLERYHAAIEAGVLTEYNKVELLFGKLVPTSPVGVVHRKTVDAIVDLLKQRFPKDKYLVSGQNPVTLPDNSEPEPDISLSLGTNKTIQGHPTPAELLLVIEVSDTTLSKDRNAKLLAYAQAGIPEYWIINVFGKQLERHTQPNKAKGTYEAAETYRPGQHFVSPSLGSYQVDDLLWLE